MKGIIKNWRDAATLILAAKHGNSINNYKLLMLKRSSKSKFMPNAYVFPGGVASPIDFSEEWKTLFKRANNTTELQSSINLEKKPLIYTSNEAKTGALTPEVAFRICAIRETFEESGILLAIDEHGKQSVFDNPDLEVGGRFGTLKEWRKKINNDDSYFLELFRETKVVPNIHCMKEWSTWITPTFPQSRRFNTIFYIGFLNEIPKHGIDCGIEITELQWLGTSGNEMQFFPPPQQLEILRISRTVNCLPAISLLCDWSTWLTPTFRDKRFNTIFYVCFVDGIRSEVVDTTEITHSQWLAPKECLSKYSNQKIALQFPQLYENTRLSSFTSFDDLKSFSRQREKRGLDLWCPFQILLNDGVVITYPGDDYHNNDFHADSLRLNESIIDIRKKSTFLNRVESPGNGYTKILNNVEWCGHPPLGNVTLTKSEIQR